MDMITLVPTSELELPLVLAAEASRDTRDYIIPWEKTQHRATMEDPHCAHLSIHDSSTKEWLGFVILLGLSSPHRSIELRRIVCVRKNQGIGRTTLQALKNLVFGVLNAHRFWLDVKSSNHRARQLYVREGFKEEGVLQECLVGNEGFESLVVMALLSTELVIPPSVNQRTFPWVSTLHLGAKTPKKPETVSPEQLIESWLAAVNAKNLERVLGLYAADAVLIPTFSNRVLNTPEKIRNYFEALSAREGLSVDLHEKTLSIQRFSKDIFALSGIYCWHFAIDGVPLSFEARFSYLIDLALSSPIVHHHSSQIPRML